MSDELEVLIDYAVQSIQQPLVIGLRDHFAAAALTGIVTNTTVYGHDEHQQSIEAYGIADAMLKARSK